MKLFAQALDTVYVMLFAAVFVLVFASLAYSVPPARYVFDIVARTPLWAMVGLFVLACWLAAGRVNPEGEI